MRHRKRSRRLGRKNAHRESTLRNLARALFIKESITTTKTKAKEAQAFIDHLITIAKENNPESKRRIFASIRDKGLITILFNEIAPRFKERGGGYTRIIPVYPRRGDGSPMAILELIEKKPKVAPKKVKKEPRVKEEKPKEKPKERPNIEEKKEHKIAPEPPPKAGPPRAEKALRQAQDASKGAEQRRSTDVKEEKREERARREEKEIKKGGFFKNLRRYFRGKAP